MKNALVILSLSLFLLTSLVSCGTKQLSDNIASSDNGKKLIVQADTSLTTSPAETEPALTPDIAETVKEPIYLPILGDSKNLTVSEKNSMDEWRKTAVELAKANTTSLFINGFTKEKKIALTFDDGPDRTITPKILDILNENNVKASFFFIGNQIDSVSNIVKIADAEGHLVLNHSFTHPQLTKKSDSEIQNELLNTENKIFQLIGKRPAIIRPPYGDLSQETVTSITQNNYKMVQWSIDTLDWSQMEKDNIVKNAVGNARPGDIILMHSNSNKTPTVEALPVIIKELTDKGYEFVTLDKLLDIPAYK